MRYTVDERRTHLELWRGSGLSKAAYCRQAEVPYHCLVAWARREEADSLPTLDAGFLEVGLPRAPVGGARLELPTGLCLHIDEATDPEWVGRLIAAVR